MERKDEKHCTGSDIQHAKPMIFVEGNVGVGKSSFLHLLSKTLELEVIYEPNNLWQDVDGYDLLGAFFLDQKRWAYTCQSYILATRVDQMIIADTTLCDKICLVERSIYSGRYFFAQVAQDIGTMDMLELSLYKKLWDREIIRIQRQPAGFIYLRAPSELSYQRIMKRGRKEEDPITMDYLKRLEEKHENWFIRKIGIPEFLAQVPVLVLDFSEDFQNDVAIQKEYEKLVLDFIDKTQEFNTNNKPLLKP